MTLRFYNTATRQVEVFEPQNTTVRLYTCGPTVYDYLTIGNWVAYTYWDILVRVLTANGLNVARVMNITDVGHLVSDDDDGEDKLEKGARREGKTAWEVAEFYTNDFLEGLNKLHLIPPTKLEKATDFIPQQLALVRTLKEKGYTYQISDGIYFDTSKFPRYGDFARLNLEEMKAGARVEFNQEKRNITDFALWKFTPEGATRDMEWDTPTDLTDEGVVRKGFPGWHLECSAIAMNTLGETLDIHTGGIDHIPIHHTNEIAQSEAASGKQFSRFWLHNNHMKVDGEKISKSLGNGYTLQDLEKKGFSPLDFRLLVLQSHYQSEANFTFDSLQAAKNRRLHWRTVAAYRWQINEEGDDNITERLIKAQTALLDTLNNNLNTPEALREIDEIFAWIESQPLQNIPKDALISYLSYCDELLGLDLLGTTPDIDEDLKEIIREREAARTEKRWDISDQLRERLQQQGIDIKDTPDGSIWSYL